MRVASNGQNLGKAALVRCGPAQLPLDNRRQAAQDLSVEGWRPPGWQLGVGGRRSGTAPTTMRGNQHVLLAIGEASTLRFVSWPGHHVDDAETQALRWSVCLPSLQAFQAFQAFQANRASNPVIIGISVQRPGGCRAIQPSGPLFGWMDGFVSRPVPPPRSCHSPAAPAKPPAQQPSRNREINWHTKNLWSVNVFPRPRDRRLQIGRALPSSPSPLAARPGRIRARRTAFSGRLSLHLDDLATTSTHCASLALTLVLAVSNGRWAVDGSWQL